MMPSERTPESWADFVTEVAKTADYDNVKKGLEILVSTFRLYHDELLRQGFTKKQAMELLGQANRAWWAAAYVRRTDGR